MTVKEKKDEVIKKAAFASGEVLRKRVGKEVLRKIPLGDKRNPFHVPEGSCGWIHTSVGVLEVSSDRPGDAIGGISLRLITDGELEVTRSGERIEIRIKKASEKAGISNPCVRP